MASLIMKGMAKLTFPGTEVFLEPLLCYELSLLGNLSNSPTARDVGGESACQSCEERQAMHWLGITRRGMVN